MSTLLIEGAKPLVGSVRLSGAKNSALKLIPAAMFSNEDIILDNVPRVSGVDEYAEVLREMGGKAEWSGDNRLTLNGGTLNTYEVPYAFGSEYRVAGLLAVPLIYRFGKAIIPRPHTPRGSLSITRWMEVWKSLGLIIEEDAKYIKVSSGNLKGANINFRISTHSGTDNAIISSLFVPGETVILNAAEEPEVDDLISFVNMMGGDVVRTEPRRIKVNGKNVFRGGRYKVMSDKNEAVFFASAALLTRGNISIEGINKTHITSFVSLLSKMGCNYEFGKEDMRIWSVDELWNSVNVTTTPSPGILTDWQPLLTLLLTQATGKSIVHDTVYTDRFDYTRDLNRMGAKISVKRPSELGLKSVISDESYNVERSGEPLTAAVIEGPTPLRGTKLDINFAGSAPALIAAVLCSEGKSEVSGFENLNVLHENIIEKLEALGADIQILD